MASMTVPDRLARYGAALLAEWLSHRFETRFELSGAAGGGFVATVAGHRAGLYLAPLWEPDAAWTERLRSMEDRLAGRLDGAYLLWAPPRADLPSDEPAAASFVSRVQEAAATLAPGGTTEVVFPVDVKMAKMREEGGYASVVGGLSRWWTRITEQVSGTYYVDSSAVHRLTRDGEARERLWELIGRLSLSVEVGQAVEFEIEEAWTLQRLPATAGLPAAIERGVAIVGAPPATDPTEGIAVRRAARKRLLEANEALGEMDVELRAVGLLGSYEYADLEGAGSTVKALDPALFNRLEVVCILADGDVRPTFLPRALPWAG